jgi:hypothetical protein
VSLVAAIGGRLRPLDEAIPLSGCMDLRSKDDARTRQMEQRDVLSHARAEAWLALLPTLLRSVTSTDERKKLQCVQCCVQPCTAHVVTTPRAKPAYRMAASLVRGILALASTAAGTPTSRKSE